ncbi:MAG: GGDEF domain-containing protein [Desulfovibrionales bacterium]|nr:GGDEF domain-containing protein [Desulfovibrionales bacterium]
MFAIRELYASVTITTLISSGVMFWLHFSRFSVRGLIWWGFGMLLYAGCLMLIALRPESPPALAIILNNTFCVSGYICIWFGIRAYLNQPLSYIHWGLGICSILSIIATIYWFTVVTPDITIRVLLISIFSALFNGLAAYDLFTHASHNKASLLIACNNVANIIAVSLRSIASFGIATPYTMHTSGWTTINFMLWSNISVAITTCGLILMLVEDLNNKLEQQASEDPLTGIQNRRALHSISPEKFFEMQQGENALGLLLLDIDHFKQVNDTYGHLVGDQFLQHFTQEVTSCLRAEDKLYRVGGEEFLVIASDIVPKHLKTLAERIRTHIEQSPLIIPEGTISHTVSIGCTTACKNDKCLQHAAVRADKAMYEAKNNGRNRVEILLPRQPYPSQ